jgi:hypothetical protein
MAPPLLPILVSISSWPAAELLTDLLDGYFPVLTRHPAGNATISVTPIDDLRRGVVVYRIVQASLTVAERHPGVDLFLLTEEGSRWRLPPPAL